MSDSTAAFHLSFPCLFFFFSPCTHTLPKLAYIKKKEECAGILVQFKNPMPISQEMGENCNENCKVCIGSESTGRGILKQRPGVVDRASKLPFSFYAPRALVKTDIPLCDKPQFTGCPELPPKCFFCVQKGLTLYSQLESLIGPI